MQDELERGDNIRAKRLEYDIAVVVSEGHDLFVKGEGEYVDSYQCHACQQASYQPAKTGQEAAQQEPGVELGIGDV